MTTSPSQSSLLEEIRLLKEELSIVKERNLQLECLLLDRTWTPPLELGLTSRENAILAVLYASPTVVSKESLISLVYQFTNENKVPDVKIIDVFVCKMRRKLTPFDLTIDTIWGRGYMMPESSRKILREWDHLTEQSAAA